MKFKTLFLASIILFSFSAFAQGQNLDLDKYDIYIGDTIISKSDFIENGKSLKSDRLEKLTFRPISDGQKSIYYLNGAIYAKGEIKNLKTNGFWTYWFKNGKKAREGNFSEGNREGVHSYWYENGNLRGVGDFKNDKYDGKWIMHKEDGSETVEQFYKKGKLFK